MGNILYYSFLLMARWAGKNLTIQQRNMTIPLSLYIHIPWCIKKCPYCDFNSHQSRQEIPEKDYIDCLIKDLESELPGIWGRKIQTIFIGGGTPSLFSPDSFHELLQQLHARLSFSPDIEITLEANPGTLEQGKFLGFRQAGINRLSLGIQSFQDDKLKLLGRIHDSNSALNAIENAKLSGFDNFNLDLMFGLPTQSLDDALSDLAIAIKQQPTHLSWYQLTIEPNTHFFQFPPRLPEDDYIFNMQEQGQNMIREAGFQQYEISAYSKSGFQCQHNRNYWEFADYLGIGAGAHSKLTNFANQTIVRKWKIKHPKQYLTADHYLAGEKTLPMAELPLEFMLNTLRLHERISTALFEERTFLKIAVIEPLLKKAVSMGLLIWDQDYIETTQQGKLFLNDLLGIFT